MHNKKKNIYIYILLITHDLYLDISFSSLFAYLKQYFISKMHLWEKFGTELVYVVKVTTQLKDLILYKSSVHNKYLNYFTPCLDYNGFKHVTSNFILWVYIF